MAELIIHEAEENNWGGIRKLLSLAILLCSLLAGVGCEYGTEELDPYGTSTPPVMRNDSYENAITVVAGEDYSLPDWVEPEEYSGYVGAVDLPRPEGSMRVMNWYVSWKRLEPEQGQYDWDYVDRKLAAAATGGYQLNMHLQSITYGGGDPDRGIVVDCKVPDWVMGEFGLTEDDLINLGWEFDILVIPGWHPGIQEAFGEFLRAFGERGYPQSPQLASAYMHAISPSRGEEFWMTQEALDRLETYHGFSVSILDDWITSRFSAYEEAFSGVTHKLVWVGKQGAWRYVSNGRYEDLALRLVQDAWDMGAGNRSSAIEKYNLWLKEPALGQDVDEMGYQVVDENLPPLLSTRFFGDENEEYGDDWVGRYGSRTGDAQRYRFAMLRALQMRFRFLWTSEVAETINPDLSRYAALSFGKSVEDSPDAWAYLRESPVSTSFSPVGVVKNFERWLKQRDLPGGMTVATQRTFREFEAGGLHGSGPDQWYDDIARRTDITTGNPSIFFDLDDGFHSGGGVQIKVEILDDSEATWYVEYTNSNHQVSQTEYFRNLQDGAVKTVTFDIVNPEFLNGLPNGMDFRIVCDGPEDLTVRWVRVVKWDGPADESLKWIPTEEADDQ